MPPAAPGGPDVRFTTNRYAEFFSGGGRAPKEIPLAIRSEGAPVTIAWTMKEKAGQNYLLLEQQGGRVIARHTLGTDGTITVNDVEKKTFSLKLDNMPAAYALAQNYPNPFNPSTVIRYSLPADGHVTLKIYNVIGELVSGLLDGEQQAGYKQVEWNASNFPSGVYFYRLEAANGPDPGKTFTQVKKMLLVR
jgi:hypothetical protein